MGALSLPEFENCSYSPLMAPEIVVLKILFIHFLIVKNIVFKGPSVKKNIISTFLLLQISNLSLLLPATMDSATLAQLTFCSFVHQKSAD